MIPRLRLEHLYLITALALGGFAVALLPIVPHDFWWHMAIGRDIARSGAIPTVDTYSWSVAPGTSFTYQSWLSELIFFWVYRSGGMAAIVWLRNTLFALTLLTLAADAQRRSGSWRLAALAAAGVTTLAINNVTMRPQSFSWLPFALYWTLLNSYRRGSLRGRSLLLLPLLMALWVNLHGAFVLGLILMLLIALGESFKTLTKRPDGAPVGRVWMLWLVCGLTLLATLANPHGAGVFGYVQNLLASSPVQSLVSEWQPLRMLSPFGVLFALSIFASAGLWLRSQRPIDLTDLLVWSAFLWLALSGLRSVIWWAMLVWPMIAGMLGTGDSRGSVPWSRRRPGLAINSIFALLVMILPLGVQPPLKALWNLPPTFRGLGAHIPDGVLLARGTPVKASAWLQAYRLPEGARLFHDLGYGSYLIWALPDLKVYVDPRIELYSLVEWQRYRRITAGCNYQQELREMGVTHLMLGHAEQADLIEALQQDTAWNALYDDAETIIYERTAAGGNVAACIQPQS